MSWNSAAPRHLWSDVRCPLKDDITFPTTYGANVVHCTHGYTAYRLKCCRGDEWLSQAPPLYWSAVGSGKVSLYTPWLSAIESEIGMWDSCASQPFMPVNMWYKSISAVKSALPHVVTCSMAPYFDAVQSMARFIGIKYCRTPDVILRAKARSPCTANYVSTYRVSGSSQKRAWLLSG